MEKNILIQSPVSLQRRRLLLAGSALLLSPSLALAGAQREETLSDDVASIMRQTCYEVLKELNLEDNPKFKLAMELEKIALKDPFFVERKLYPNVDFYSGIVLSALGIPTSMFTVIFALARSVGWISHWHEMIGDPSLKIGRPRQLYTGAPRRDFVPPEQR